MDKVIGGTPKGIESICTTCRLAQVVRGVNLQSVVICHASASSPVRIQFPVERCSVYDDKRMPPLYQMREIAWEIKARKRGQVGFAENGEMSIEVTPPDPAKHVQPLPAVGKSEE